MILFNYVRVLDLDITPITNPEPMTVYYGSRSGGDALEVYVCFQDNILRPLAGGGDGGVNNFFEVSGTPILDYSGSVGEYYLDMYVPKPLNVQSNGFEFMMKEGQTITLSGVVNATGCRNWGWEGFFIATSWKVDITLMCDNNGKISVFNKSIVADSSPREGQPLNFWGLDVVTEDGFYPSWQDQQNGFNPLEPMFFFKFYNLASESFQAEVEVSGKLLYTETNARKFLLD